MKVSYSPRALTQLDEIFSYIARDSSSAASNLIDRIEALALLPGQLPQMGRATDKPGVRVIGMPGHPYLIFDKIIEEKEELRDSSCATHRPSPAAGLSLMGRTAPRSAGD